MAISKTSFAARRAEHLLKSKNDNKQAMDCVLLALKAAMDPDRVPVALSVQLHTRHPKSLRGTITVPLNRDLKK